MAHHQRRTPQDTQVPSKREGSRDRQDDSQSDAGHLEFHTRGLHNNGQTLLAEWYSPHSTKARVMKMVPKKADKRCLKDWCPLTMLSIVYKIIAKLLVNRLSPHNNACISPQQTGLIPGHFILKNISLAWLTHY